MTRRAFMIVTCLSSLILSASGALAQPPQQTGANEITLTGSWLVTAASGDGDDYWLVFIRNNRLFNRFSGATFALLSAQLAFQPTYTGGVFVAASQARRLGTPVTNWIVTQRFVSVNGPDNCWVREQRQRLTGAVFADLPMAVTRSNGAIRLDGSFFLVNYRGTYSGTEVTASGVAPLEGGGRRCQDGTSFTQMAGASALSGSFSADDQRATLTARGAGRDR